MSGRRIWLSTPIQAPRERPPTLTEDTLILPSLSPVGDKPISAVIDDRCTSADVLLLQEVERRLNLGWRLACRIPGSQARLPIGSMRSCGFACWRLSPAIPTAMTATCCAAIPSSKWRWTGLGAGAVLAALPHREHAAAPGTLSHGDARPVLRQFPDRPQPPYP